MRVHHTALSVPNLSEAILFYTAVFGLTTGKLWERPEDMLKGIILTDEDGGTIELIQHERCHESPAIPSDLSELGLKHIAFVVDKLEPCFYHAYQGGATLVHEPREGVAFKRTAFIADPWGNVIELAELRD